MLRPSCGCGSFFSARCDAVSGCFPHFISSPACISAVKVSSAHIPAAGSPVHPPFARKSRLPFAAGIFSLATCRQLFYSRHVIAGRECLKSSQLPRPLVSDASPAGGCGDSYIPQPHDHGAPPLSKRAGLRYPERPDGFQSLFHRILRSQGDCSVRTFSPISETIRHPVYFRKKRGFAKNRSRTIRNGSPLQAAVYLSDNSDS